MAAYTTIDKPSDFFSATLYTANATARTIATGHQSDWVWLKRRDGTAGHRIADSVRGATKLLYSDSSTSEQTDAKSITGFVSTGFTLGDDANGYDVNTNTNTMVAWSWKTGTSFTNDASSTGIGTIDSNGSVSSDAGFGIVKWSGTGSAGTIAHNMGSTPSFLIIKRLSDANWLVQATSLGYGNYLALNTTGASASASTLVTGVSSTLVTLGDNGSVNGSGQDYIGYFFSEKQGYSKFGSYTGNGNANGPFVYTGFRPAFLIIKNTSQATDWIMYDNKRDGFEPQNKEFRANTSAAERNAEDNNVQFCANGFKLRNAGTKSNADSGNTLIYIAFAENPFVTSTGVPGTAR